jgi:hypothetical protein
VEYNLNRLGCKKQEAIPPILQADLGGWKVCGKRASFPFLDAQISRTNKEGL